jgi:ABC-type branched-subunit amino acid transport system substrate-binding protein
MKKRILSTIFSICSSLAGIALIVMVVCVEIEAAETLHLGATVPFQSRIGIQLKNILLMNADLLNKAGGLTVGGKTYMIEYHIYDDKYSADAGRAAIEKLVFEDKIKFNVGTFGSAPTLAMLGVTEPNKIPIFGGAASEKLLSPNIKYFVHTFPAKLTFSFAKALKESRPDIKTVMFVTYDDETGHTLAPTNEKAHKAFGRTILPTIYFKHGETDFSRIATKIVALKPDYVNAIGIMVEAENVQLVKALREAGYKGTLDSTFILSQPVVDSIIAKVGKEGAEGIYGGIYDPTLPAVINKPAEANEFRKNYEKYYGKWETDGLQWAGCWYTWLAAVKKADSIDPDKVMAVVDRELKISTPIGPVKLFRRPDLDNNRFCDYATVIRGGMIKDGKIVMLFERDPDFMIRCVEEVYGVKMQ